MEKIDYEWEIISRLGLALGVVGLINQACSIRPSGLSTFGNNNWESLSWLLNQKKENLGEAKNLIWQPQGLTKRPYPSHSLAQ
jgi:hypothetical protein